MLFTTQVSDYNIVLWFVSFTHIPVSLLMIQALRVKPRETAQTVIPILKDKKINI